MNRNINKKERTDWVYEAPGDVERVEAFFNGKAFAPHRHDTYAIGMTLAGMQCFDYRGGSSYSQPGCAVVIHPDELHDGRAGNEEGFRYRVTYVEPSLIQAALGGKGLPFIEGGSSNDQRICAAVASLLGEYDRAMDPLEYDDAIFDLAHAMDAASGSQRANRKRFDYRAAEMARQYITDNLNRDLSLEDLERVSGRDRWKLSRDFRTLFGTSPYRYILMRRLDRARDMIGSGKPLVEAAHACLFADQSHMTRTFKKTYGVTPKQWLQIKGTPARNIKKTA